MFAGGDDNKDGDRAYSTYINASYNIACPEEITLTPPLVSLLGKECMMLMVLLLQILL